MKISAETIQVLKNFATINPNLLIREGNELRTISAARAVFAKATVSETFPREVAIYDLNSLLQLLTFADDQNIDFETSHVTIQNDSGMFQYFYCQPNLIQAPPTKNVEVEAMFTFNLSSKDIQIILKTVSLLAAPNISIKSKDGKVSLIVGDKKNDTANTFRKNLGESDKDFECIIATDNFKVIPDAYEIAISSKKICEFKSQSRNLSYLIAAEPDSVV